MTGLLALSLLTACGPEPAGPWRAVLDLAGGELRFAIEIENQSGRLEGRLCNGGDCHAFSGVGVRSDTLRLEMADYAATITATLRGDSLVGAYANVGNRGPRTIPFRAARGRWPVEPPSAALIGSWDGWVLSPTGGRSPRVFHFRATATGLEGTLVSNAGDFGNFWGSAQGSALSMSHFDGSYVYLLTARLEGDTLRGIFHAGLRTQSPFVAVRSTGKPHLLPPAAVTRADTTIPFRFAFPDLEGRLVTNDDPRFRGKVVLVDVFGSWCPTCHDAAPVLVQLYREFHDRGFEAVGLAYEVTGDPAIDGRLVRRFRDKFGIPWPLLLAGINDTQQTASTLPQLQGFTAYPTLVFLGRDGRVRHIHAGFYGPALGAQHARLVQELRAQVEELLREK
jgi:thiol-disulfide isomerase/thioredoxin